jgi:hypothetical protein
VENTSAFICPVLLVMKHEGKIRRAGNSLKGAPEIMEPLLYYVNNFVDNGCLYLHYHVIHFVSKSFFIMNDICTES